MTSIKSHLTPELFRELRDFWYGHLDSEDSLVVLQGVQMKPWFMGGAEFDQACVSVAPLHHDETCH